MQDSVAFRGGQVVNMQSLEAQMNEHHLLGVDDASSQRGRVQGVVGGVGGVEQGHGVGLFASGGAYWPLALANGDPLWVGACFGCVNGAPG